MMAPIGSYPDPMVIPPSAAHKQTLILLHGSGSSAAKFGPPLLATPILGATTATVAGPGSHPLDAAPFTLSTAFPHARFVFPTAPRGRATIYKRSIINQWFDRCHLHEPDKRDWLQIDGLQQTTTFLHDLLRREIELVGGARNVILGGISQGCAASLIAMLLWEGEPLGAVLGMCGWLPFCRCLEDVIASAEEGNNWGMSTCYGIDFDPFERSSSGPDLGQPSDAVAEPCALAIDWLREQLEMPPSSTLRPPVQATPLFLGHGDLDEKVPIVLGRDASDCLRTLGVDVTWREYEGLEHWYSPAMLRELLDFVRSEANWKG